MAQRRAHGLSGHSDYLASVPLFAGIPKHKLEILTDLCHEHRYQPGDEIVREGDTSGRLYLIESGHAEVQVHGHVVNELGPGQHFGEYAVLDRAPRSATVVATTDVHAFSLASITVRPLLKEEADITYRLLLNAVDQLRALDRSLL